LIVAAGLVKGDGFETEAEALSAVQQGRNIIPGWRSLPRLAGLVEFGSFTRWPRLGNPGTVVWRDVPTHSTQNRVGLRNPGAKAAAAFLRARGDRLPPQFGINLAVSPGVDDPAEQTQEMLEALAAFVEGDVLPSWFTLNLSCPNTQDDPNGNQTADYTAQLCGALVNQTAGRPLWVKVGPTLSDDQYRALLRVVAEVGAQAVVATNTLPQIAPGEASLTAGVGGRRLHARTVEVVSLLMREKTLHSYPVDVIGCGGVEDGASYQDFARLGAHVVQYWSSLVFRGPLVSALIAQEAGL
jgi:dihydroorotate dehydrogenase